MPNYVISVTSSYFMKQYWTTTELISSWRLSQSELQLIDKKENKLIYALKMRYFDLQGYFPR